MKDAVLMNGADLTTGELDDFFEGEDDYLAKMCPGRFVPVGMDGDVWVLVWASVN